VAYKDKAKERAYRQTYQRRWMKEQAERWRRAGCCTKCGIPVKQFKMCLECREKISRWHQSRVEARPARHCVVHPWVRIYLNGCRTCGAIVASQACWGQKDTFQKRVRAELIKGWQTVDALATATGLSNIRVRTALGVLRRYKQRDDMQLQTRTGWNSTTARPVCFYRLERAQQRSEAA